MSTRDRVHPSIIAPELWDAVQTQLQAGAAKPRKRTTKGRAARSPLAGKLFDETGDRLTPSHTKKKNGQRLRYYVSRRLIQHSGQKDLSGWRLPAPMLEQTVVHLIRQHVDATTFSASLIHTPTMQELASVRLFLDGLSVPVRNNDSLSRDQRRCAPCAMLALLWRFASVSNMNPQARAIDHQVDGLSARPHTRESAASCGATSSADTTSSRSGISPYRAREARRSLVPGKKPSVCR